MTTPKIVFINGAPRSGKDTLADMILGIYFEDKERSLHYLDMEEEGFKNNLIEAVVGLFGVSWSEWVKRYESQKDEPWDQLQGKSQREALIWMSEVVAKPTFGKEFFGAAMVTRLKTHIKAAEECERELIILIPDAGFIPETMEVVNHFGKENCRMINTFRNGTNFDKDSRSLITGKDLDIHGALVTNNGTKKDLYNKAADIYKQLIS